MNKLLCPSPDTLESLLAATLSAEQETIVTTHIEDCIVCQTRLETLTDDQLLKSFSAGKLDPGSLETAPSWLLSRLLKPAKEVEQSPEVLSFLKPPVQEGDLGLLGSYRILKVLGRGGMGVVLQGYDASLKRLVALKVLWPPPNDLAARNRIFREAQAVARIQHVHVVGIYSVHNEPGGPPYLTMEYVPGKTLRDHLKQSEAALMEILSWCREIADGLSAAHAVGLIHRDIKPTNILIDENTNQAKLTDFGLARVTEGALDQTKQALLAGTPAYMSPEQMQHPELVDVRSDVYGLGATLYEALTGTPPHRGPVEVLIRQVVDIEPVSPRRINLSIPVDIETICMKCLAKEPSRRYASAADFSADLQRYLSGRPILARPIGLLSRAIKAFKRHPVPYALAALLLMSLINGTLISLYYWRHAERNLTVANEKIETAFRTIDQFCLQVSQNRLLNESGMLPLRQELLKIAVPELQKLSLDRPSDPLMHEKWIKSTYLLAKLKHDTEGPAAALPLLQTVMPELHERHQTYPDNSDARRLLADVLMYEGICRENLRQYQQAETIWKEIERLLVNHNAPEDQLILARLYVNWNKTWADQLNYQRSNQYAGQAQAISKNLSINHPELIEGRMILATSTGNLAHGQVALRQWKLAEESYHQAIGHWKQLMVDDPRQLVSQVESIRTHTNLIDLLLITQRYGEAGKIVYAQLPVVDRLLRKYPQSITLSRFHGKLHLDAGLLAHIGGRSAEAEQQYQLAATGLSTCHAEYPEEASVFYDLIRVRLLQCYQSQDARQLEKALAGFEEVLLMLHEYIGLIPEAEQEMNAHRQSVLLCRAMVYEELGKWDLAKDNIQSVIHDGANNPAFCQMALLLLEEKSSGKDQTTELKKYYRKMMEECLAAEKLGPAPGPMYFLAATFAGRSLELIGQDTSLAQPDRTAMTEQYRSAALRWLQTARGYGYFASKDRQEALFKGTQLQSLHQTPQWKALVNQMR